MNRRTLFRRAGKLGAGLGLAAVVGVTVQDEPEATVFSGFSQPTFSEPPQTGTTLVINEHKYQPFEMETLEDGDYIYAMRGAYTFDDDGKVVKL